MKNKKAVPKLNLKLYCFKNQHGEVEIPFAEYMERYQIFENESDLDKTRKTKQIMNIKAHIDYLVENQGRYNVPDKIQQYVDRDIGILKIKEGNNLIRIAFMTIPNDCIILLNAIDKPALYEKSKKSQVDKYIQSFLDMSEYYKSDYLHNKLAIDFYKLYAKK